MPLLLALPIEVLDNIAFHFACPKVQGLPEDLTPFLLVSRRIYHNLSHSPALHARIFKFKFSHSATSRRTSTPQSKEYAWQLKSLTQILSLVRCRSAALLDMMLTFCEQDPDEPSVTELLFSLWIMCLDDNGCNRLQMEWAGAYEWVNAFVHTQMYAEADHGWPLQGARNSCALWVMWHLTTKARLLAEPPSTQQQLVNIVLPFDRMVAHTPVPHPLLMGNTLYTCHPIEFGVSNSAKLLYFSHRELSPFSILPHLPLTQEDQFITEAQRDGEELSSLELQRLIAAEVSLMQEDIKELNASLLGGGFVTNSSFGKGGGTALTVGPSIVVDSNGRIIEVDESDCSMRKGLHSQLVNWPMVPSQLHLEEMLWPQGPQPEDGRPVHPRPEDFTENRLGLTKVPVYMRLTEHVCYAPNPVIPCGGRSEANNASKREFDQGLRNGYFPNGMRHRKSPDGEGIIFSVLPPTTSSSSVPQEYYYQTLKPKLGDYTNKPKEGKFHDVGSCPGCRAAEEARQKARLSAVVEEDDNCADDTHNNMEEDDFSKETVPLHDLHKVLDCDGIQDIVITGETDNRHSQAWNHFTFHGRIRHHDGMVGILRCPRRAGVGSIFFYGTIIGGQNFVGNWRVANVDVGTPTWEGAFSLGKKVE
ncbi:hypothetical protein L218DRAFT_1033105 [Marasmius fiardii PR-910]|nr:hypothetical protein L218DRAFT_1033105 [Marasmius fiardii PR-910]